VSDPIYRHWDFIETLANHFIDNMRRTYGNVSDKALTEAKNMTGGYLANLACNKTGQISHHKVF
jgi:hypothetical protein